MLNKYSRIVAKMSTLVLAVSALVGAAALPSVAFAYQNRAKLEQLGFSADGNSFVLVQTIRDGGIGGITATAEVIDVAKNACVQTGCVVARGLGRDDNARPASETLQEVLIKTWLLRSDLGLTPPQEGTVLSISDREDRDDGTTSANFRDEANNRTIGIEVRQVHVPGSSASGEYIPEHASVEITVADGHSYATVDNINEFTKHAQRFDLKEMRLSPNGHGIAIVFDKVSLGFEGSDHEYFVETLDFPSL